MNKASKAALLSALVFPGLGHLVVKKYWLALAVAVVSTVSLYVLVSDTISKTLQVLEKVKQGEIAPDVISMMTFMQQQPSDTQQLTMAFYSLIAAWIFGVGDSYRVGRKLTSLEAPK